MIAWHLMCFCPAGVKAQRAQGSLSGAIVDAATQEPLIGVNVVVVGTQLGAATDLEGSFQIPGVPAGTYQVAFKYIGYESFIKADIVVRPGRSTVVNAGLKATVLETEGVTVTAGYYQKNETELTSATAFSTEEIRRAPGAGQEISRVLNSLAGVASRGETSQDLFVRGGSPLENGFYIDHIFIPNAAHFVTGDGSSFGPIGLINTEFVEQIDFYTGGFSAAYGDRLSSISSIRYREGNLNEVTGEVGINFAGGTAILEGPWMSDKGTFFVSGRRSYLDLIANAINAGGAPSFGDIQGKATYKLDARNSLSVLNLFGQSRFKQSADDALDAGDNEFIDVNGSQNTTGITWTSVWNQSGVSTTSASYSFLLRDFASRRLDDRTIKLSEDLRSDYVFLRNVNLYQFGPRLKVDFGGEFMYERGSFDFLQEAFVNRSGLEQPDFARGLDEEERRFGGFVSVIGRPAARLQLTAGVRTDYASLNENVVVSPRFAASYQLTPRLYLNGSAGLFHQNVPLFIVAQDAANRELKHMQARHLIVGVEYLFTPDTRLTVEVYDKQYRDMPQITDDNGRGNPSYVLDNRGDYAGSLVSEGESYARGVDVMLQKKLAEQVYGLISASYFRARYTDFEGVERNRLFDNRVLFNVIGGYKPSDVWEVSIRWSYAGGRPVTPFDEVASQQLGDEVWDLSRFNAERLPAYHSLFVRADRRFNFRASSVVTYLSVWNAYSRANVEENYWNVAEDRTDERTQFSLLPVLGVEWEF